MNEYLIDIPGRLHSVAVEKHVAGTDLIYDDTLKTTLDILNLENITDVKIQNNKLQFLNIQELLLKEISIASGTQKQSDWNLTDSTQVDFIKNKPTIYNKLEVDDKLIAKQDIINDLVTIRSGAELGATAYQKPQSGIPSTDLASDVQSDLIAVSTIEQKIPAQASSSNQLADKDFVNSSIATATATYRGAYNLVADLHLSVSATHAEIATALATAIQIADKNDYCYVLIPVADATPTSIEAVERYKHNGTVWEYEYTLNNSGYTAAQWEALNSGITSGLVAKLSALPTNSELTTLLSGKVDKENGKGLSANDYTTDDKDKLNSLPTATELTRELESKANKIPMPPVVHDLIIEGTTQVSDVITLITGHFYPRTDTQIDSNYANPAVIEFTVNYNGELRFTGSHVYGGILKYIKAYVNGTLVEISTERITSATLNFNVEANDVVKVEFTRYVTDNLTGCIGNLSITSAGVPKDLVDIYNSLAPVATSGSYNDLSDKPDLSAFITRSVDDLTNYYLKSETYTKNEVLQLIGAIQQFHYEVYPTLPQTGASNVLYLIGPTGSGSDKYEEYVYANNDWTKIGDTSIDLSGYVTTQALNTALADYVTSSALSVTLANYYNKTEVDGLLAGKENAMPIVQVASGTTAINAAVNTYYEVAGEVGVLGIILPEPTDMTKVSMVVVHLTAGTTPNVVIGSTETIDYSAAYDISASKEYEINCLYNGDKWIVADMEVV